MQGSFSAQSRSPSPSSRHRRGTGASEATTLTIYSGRDEEFVKSLFDDFTEATGIETEVRYGDLAELAATILEEGENSPADVFFSQDAGSLGAVAEAGSLAPLDEATLDRVEDRFRSDDGTWVGTSGRGRVLAYNTDIVEETAAARIDRRPDRPGMEGQDRTASHELVVPGARGGDDRHRGRGGDPGLARGADGQRSSLLRRQRRDDTGGRVGRGRGSAS